MRIAVFAACIAAAFAVFPLRAQEGSQRSNVLILIADDVGVDNVSAYGEGATPPPTPNIDALAARGVLFRNAWANAMCSPSRACFMTGRYSFRTGVGWAIRAPLNPVIGSLRDEEITLPEALDMGRSGYAHAAFGKWHLAREESSPNDAGWSHYAGLIAGSSGYFEWPRTVNGVTAISRVYATTKTVDDALQWIRAQNGPWVCYVSFLAGHSPYHTPPAALHTRNLSSAGEPNADPRPYFEAMVEAMDTEIGRLLGALGPALDRTNVLFVGDNGTTARTVLPPFTPCHAKRRPYEGGVNVPLIVAGPAVVAGGREEPALVAAVDLFSTVTELAGVDSRSVVPPWVPLDSVSMVPYLENPTHAPLRTTVFAEMFFGGASYAEATSTEHAEIRDDRYKLIRVYSAGFLHPGVLPGPCEPRGPFPYEELYDLQQDPFEANNLLAGTLTVTEQQRYDALVLAFDELRRPPGAFSVFGSPGCVGSNGNPTISGAGLPTIGGSYDVQLSFGARSSVAELLIGSSYTQNNGASLPIDLSLFGAGPSCLLYTSTETSVSAATNANGLATVSITVPPELSLVGKTLYHSWLVVDPAAPNNYLGITSSNGAAAVIGL